MDFSPSPTQQELVAAVRDFASTHLTSDMIARDRDESFSREIWERCADFGIQGLPFPTELGGSGQDALTTVMAMEALGQACPDSGLNFAIAAQMWSVQMPIHSFGSDEQRERYLPRLNRGEWIGAHGMSEPDSGSDAFALRTTARPGGDGYVLNGTKTFVSNAPVANLFLVFATVDRSLGALGITGFLVERDTAGFHVGQPIEKMGLRTAPMAELTFDDCVLPAGQRLGREGRGASIFNDSMGWERACILAGTLGAMQRQLDLTTRYAKERQQFGKSIGANQSVSSKLADIAVRLEAGRLLLYKAAWLRDRGADSDLAASIAKVFISEAAVATSLACLQVHGGYGFTTEYEVERDLRDSVGSTLYSGTSEIQRAMIARRLGLGF